MTRSLPPVTQLPMARSPQDPFAPPPELAALRDEAPLRPMIYPDGHEGWLATGHAEVRAVLADERLSNRTELVHHYNPMYAGIELPPASPGDMDHVDGAAHARLRKPVAGWFSVRRVRELTDRVEELAAEYLDAMVARRPPVDLVQAFAFPVPATIICEMLGVPYADRAEFKDNAAKTTGSAPPEAVAEAWQALLDYIGRLVAAKRADPGDDILSALTETDISDAEISGIGAFLLGAGLDTTANMLSLGTFALLRNPDQLAAWRADPNLTDSAVEELLRYLTPPHTGVRSALADVEIAGQVIKAGQTVTVSTAAANRDPRRFPDPDTLDLARRATGHLAFSHGIHQCLGQQLARIELRVAFPALLRQFPTLRLAVPAAEVRLRTGADDVYGVHELPVEW
ncbi:cytochrome P450 [Nocardia wallacei]|uniref:cytochrome P450 n=1 Tax=Nocardia wallacei TaxID=480035 RepID=UPI0024575E21|nr:cytochrome P450 [Nocardia wallacei]